MIVTTQSYSTALSQFGVLSSLIMSPRLCCSQVPTTAKAILEGNAAGELPSLNLQGFLVGNAWTNATADNTGAVDVS